MKKRKILGRYIRLLFIITYLITLTACASNMDETKIDTSIAPEEEMTLSLASCDYEKAVAVYNKRIYGTELEDQFNSALMNCITDIVTSWSNLELEYEPASVILDTFANLENSELAAFASEQFNLVTIEGKSSDLLIKAQDAFETDNYIDAMVMISQISTEYSQYDIAQELYDYCKDIILAFVEKPTSVTEFEEFISQLKNYIKQIEEPAFSERILKLERELVIFKDIEKITQKAQIYYNKGEFGEAFSVLEAGMNKYPGNAHMQDNFQGILDLFIINTTTQAKAACEEKEYKEALNIVNAAIAEYDCEELQELLIFVREEKNFLFKLKNDVVDAVTSFKESWKQEDLTVKEAGSMAGAYIVKSGKKILLGDYTDEEVTVLSCGGNVVASIANLDMLFDIRDLTYDIQNWGEGEYFVARLAVDTIALIPVIGMVKYMKYADAAGDAVKGLENIADITKVSDSISDAAKTADNIGDAVGTAKVLSKTSEVTGQTIKTKLGIKPYIYKKTPNSHLSGQYYPDTDVLLEEQKLKYSSGVRYIGTFPVFNSVLDVPLPKELYKATEYSHKKYLNDYLKEKIIKGDKHLLKQFTAEEIDLILKGQLPSKYVWHHNEKEGLLQLVLREEHEKVRHIGGMALWGIGYGNKASIDVAA